MAHTHPAQEGADEPEQSPGYEQERETGNIDGPPEEMFPVSQARLQLALRRAQTNYAQLERTQSQLRAIIDASQEAMLLLTPDGRPIKVNRRFTDFFGLDDTTVLSQSPEQLMVLLKEVFKASGSLERWLAWSTRDQEHIFREEQVQAASSPREFALSSLPVKDVHQTYLGRLYVWYDVTHEREVERVKSTFVSIISHEFRTPLTNIEGFSQLMCDEDFSLAEMKEFAADIHSDAKRLSRMISDMLDLDRMESGRTTLYPEQVDLNALLTAVVGHMRPTAPKHVFRFQLESTLPLIVADKDKLMQVITNLVANAVKYSPEGGEIRLSSCREADITHVQVQDQGMGIPADALEQVFERYKRIEAESTRHIKGTGLGLPIVRQIIQMHGGKVWAESTLGQGSIFHFTLPLAGPPSPRI